MNRNNKEWNCKTVAFLTLGCKVNSYETEAMQKLFEDEGIQVVDFTKYADVYVVNTCTVTNIADRKSRQMLHKARKMNENAVVVAVGCYVQAAKEVLEQDEAIDVVIGNNKKKDIIKILKEHFLGNNIKNSEEADFNHPSQSTQIGNEGQDAFNNENVIDIGRETEYEELSIESVAEKTRAYIKIQDGCNQFCSYCIIPYARGRVRSRAQEAVILEIKKLVLRGYKEVVLTGIHLSSYGIDFKENIKEGIILSESEDEKEHPLLELIKKINDIAGLERIRLGSLEPRIITDKFAKTLSELTKVCPHFHLSLQSGCDKTLKRMNRKYNTQEYYDKCVLLRKYFINPAITTDVIVGFPGETQEEFEETFVFLKKIKFAQLHVFKYSVRKGTKAEQMPDQVKEETKGERSSSLIALGEKMTQDYLSLFLGKTEKILVEEGITLKDCNYQVGHNERYLKLGVLAEENLTNKIVLGKVIGILNKEIMFCEIMD